jgi:hypothetical protein
MDKISLSPLLTAKVEHVTLNRREIFKTFCKDKPFVCACFLYICSSKRHNHATNTPKFDCRRQNQKGH